MTRVEALVKSELLVWGREDAGYTLEEAAKKLSVSPERLSSWERGETKPTIIQLRKIARAYKRPLAVFFLSRPPKKFQAMHDFRRLPGQVAGHESPSLRYVIGRVRFRRQIALELFESLGVEPVKFSGATSINDNPEEVAAYARDLLGIDFRQQEGWRSKYEALNAWRDSLEQHGILVFQVQDVPVEEMRGFSVSEAPLPAIAINMKDAVNGRIFTALHEFTHLMLREAGICDLVEGSVRPPAEQRVEVFCNHVAGAMLVPLAVLLRDSVVREHGRQMGWSDFELQALAKKFSASREVILRRLLVAGRTSGDFYSMKVAQYQQEYEEYEAKKSEGFAPPATVALSSAGSLFTGLVLESYHRENITSSDVAEYLDVRLKHIPKIEESVLRRSVARGELE